MYKKAKTTPRTGNYALDRLSTEDVQNVAYFLTSEELLSFRLVCKYFMITAPMVTVTATHTPSPSDVATATTIFVNASNMDDVQLGDAIMLDRSPIARTVVIQKMQDMAPADNDDTLITQSLHGHGGTRVDLKVSCYNVAYNSRVMAIMNHPRVKSVECKERKYAYKDTWHRSNVYGWEQTRGPWVGGPYRDSEWGAPYSHEFCNIYDVMRITSDDPELYKDADYWIHVVTTRNYKVFRTVCDAIHRKHLVSQLETHGLQISPHDTVHDLYSQVCSFGGRDLDEELAERERDYDQEVYHFQSMFDSEQVHP